MKHEIEGERADRIENAYCVAVFVIGILMAVIIMGFIHFITWWLG